MKNFCPKCGKKIKGRVRKTLCENCLMAEYQKNRQIKMAEDKKFVNPPEEEIPEESDIDDEEENLV